MTTRQPLYKSLYVQVLVAITIGILLGHFYPETGVALKPLGDGFVKLIKMVIAPIIFCTVVSGIAGMQSMKSVGKTGGYALLYFEIVSTIALIIGLVVVNVVKPGAGMHIDVTTLNASSVAAYAAAGAQQTTVGFLLNIIPNTVVGAFANGDILQVLMFSVIFGFALHRLGSYGKPVLDLIDRFAHVMFNIINMIMKLAPVGAFGAMAFTIGQYGVGSLVQLGYLMACFYVTCLLFVLVVLGGICRAHGFSVLKLIRYIREELMIVLGTSSSESALPRMLAKMERLGAKKSVVGLVIPTGYSFNLDGTSIYLTMAAVFIAQATDTTMDITHQITLLLVLLVASKGAAGVTGSGFIVLAATLSAVGHLPVAGLALILGIDRFMSEARALTNLVGNAVATVVVAKWVNEMDNDKLASELASGGAPLEDTRPTDDLGVAEGPAR
ncbi:dicarboxylate/amino acid:cation symporter [Pseudomonas kermanshahensis]|jgi:aerobic C4-dicarboxylate transport protein|uniref:C4-dicarboxylate transport protein n=1 Tax=Pseudomonas kermanshahensis TaxID=2745482 RepID=A0ABU8R8B9_9PSED|nr:MULTISPECIES: dicarboxylate/amino acid:cation symporter [Pseudomonas]ATP51633.1 dicarboxylate/amino acid:cation symporter [Pseudomonas putida]MBC3487090.1 dicarboxylate/amino acid:cation symporter [Pseudomonas sp. SWRI50]MBC3498401.1 dicarboxylate/amino acid:cation symporter [Pseudomonas sp. SWRI67]MBV4528305.1 dicarboxylate/amino acid:cation symporter [Pseudomonas kermanshahensis]MCX2688547.1 dicarboxylate/amino acid:cation symporter [Pseudomonas sp. DCB_AW]